MEKKLSPTDLIIKTLKEKSVLKQDVYGKTYETFNLLKEILKKIAGELHQTMSKVDKRIIVNFKDRGQFECELQVAGDLLFFNMHTNIFEFDKTHQVWKSSYVKEDSSRAFCGMISVYNFLADSFKYNRNNDLGYVIGRLFINKDGHYYMEGKRQLGFLYNDFVNDAIDKDKLRAIAESAIIYCLNFDLYVPPFDQVKEVTVMEMLEASNNLQFKTGKRLGFRFQADNDQIE